MSSFEEEPYSTIFASLKHPIRRKILRMLSEKPRSFSEILEVLGISSSHLTYHLENLGQLVSKMDDGKYKLSTFGEAAVGTMSKVEEAPKVTQPKRLPSLVIKWRFFCVGFMIGLAVLTGVSYIQCQSLNRMSAEYERLFLEYEPLKELAELVKKGAVLESQYTLTYEYEEGNSWARYGGDSHCVIYSAYDNSTLNLALSINMIVSGSYVPISVQEGNVVVLGWNETAPVVYSVNTTVSSIFSVPLASKGWYTVSLVGPLKPPTGICRMPTMIPPKVDCWMSLRIIYGGNYSPFIVIA
jgi:DNA-binding transcriptional ArsR family regulator